MHTCFLRSSLNNTTGCRKSRVYATEGSTRDIEINKNFVARVMALEPAHQPAAVGNSNIHVVDIGATKTYWGFAGEDLPSQQLTSAWCYTGERWSGVPCNFLEKRTSFTPHFLYTYNDQPEFLAKYLGSNTPGVNLNEPSSGGFVNHQICQSALKAFLSHLDNFYTEEGWSQTSSITAESRMDDGCGEDSTVPSTQTNVPRIQGGQLLMTEPTRKNVGHSSVLAEMAFETYDVDSWYGMRKAPLSAFALGRSTALVAEMGAQNIQISPVFEGYTLQSNSEDYCVGGGLLECALAIKTDLWSMADGFANFSPWRSHCADLIGEEGDSKGQARPRYKHQARREIVSDLAKHVLCIEPGEDEDLAYELPDGKCIYLMKNDCANIAEFIFDPRTARSQEPVLEQIVGGCPYLESWPGLASALMNVGFGCDVEVLQPLFQNIVLSGGLASLDGLTERVNSDLINERKWNVTSNPGEVSIRDSTNFRLKVCSQSRFELPFSPWIGASMVGNLSSFDSYWISKSEWQEYGAHILDKRLIF